MNKYPNHGYIISQLLDCGVNKSLLLKQNSADMMVQHKLGGIYNVNYIMSSNLRMSLTLPSATSTKFFAQHVLTIAHVGVSMNLIRRQQMSNNLKKNTNH
jgi:hypothetical protein